MLSNVPSLPATSSSILDLVAWPNPLLLQVNALFPLEHRRQAFAVGVGQGFNPYVYAG